MNEDHVRFELIDDASFEARARDGFLCECLAAVLDVHLVDDRRIDRDGKYRAIVGCVRARA